MEENRHRVTRRRFLGASAAVVAGLALPMCGAVAVYRTQVRNGRIQLQTAAHPELQSAGGGIALNADGLPRAVLLVNVDGTRFRAFSSMCTHLGCSVRLSGAFLRCPCHGSTYDLEGRVVRGPAQRALATFETEESNGVVTIFLWR